jgi:glycosyltransferase involved in cell wall biosynthesis
MTEKLTISIVTPSYNQDDYIERTLNSVLSQETDFRVELIVMDGGSTDGTPGILNKYNGKIQWVSERDKGQCDALNKGIKRSSGDIIGYLNSDDLYLPGALQKVGEYFTSRPDCSWLYGRCRIIDEEDREIRKWMTLYKNLVSKRFIYPLLLIENFISQPAVFFRRSAIEKAGMFKLDLPLAMDYDLWIRLAKSGMPGVLEDYLACFRVHKQAKSAQYSKQQFLEQYRIHQLHDQRKLLLFLHRVNIARTIAGYWLLARLDQTSRNE